MVDRKRPYVMIGMPVNRDLPSPTVHSLMRSQGAAMNGGVDICFQTYDGCSLVHKARNAITDYFLKSDCTHLFWIDSDLSWSEETFIKFSILGSEMDVLCGAYPKKEDKPQFYLTPIDYKIMTNNYGCIEIKRMAMGFSIAQRKVIEALANKAEKIRIDSDGPLIPYIFRLDVHDGEMRGEDMAYCADIRELGFKIWLDPSAAIGHIGQKCFDHKIIDQMKVVDVADVQRTGTVAA